MAVAVVAYLLWGLLTIYWKQLERFDAAELILWRMACAAVVMAVVVSVRRSWTDLRRSAARPATFALLVVSALLLTVNWGSYVWAVVNDRVIETALGYFMAPLATMAIGVLVLGEVPTASQRLAFGLAAVAVVVLTISYGRPPWIALVLAATWSLYGLAKRRVGLPAVESLAGETLVLVVPALATIAFLGDRDGGVIATASAREWVFVLGTGVITAVPLLLFASAAASIPFTLLGPLNLIVPVINFGLGWLLYDEPMPLDRIIGFAFVWAALAAVIWDRVQAARTPAVVAVPLTS